MEPVIWVEILSRHHDVTARHRCSGGEIRIGRAYDNDIILDDPYVAPRHLRLHQTQGNGWTADDLGTANGIRTERGKIRLDRIDLDDDQIIRIGRTLLRLRSASYPVVAERVDALQRPLWPAALAVAGGIVGVEVVMDWLSETAETRVPVYIGALVPIGLMTLGWVGVWTILCRVFTGQARFERHLVIALAGVLGYSLTDEVLKLAGFALSWQVLLGYEYVAMWAIIALVSFGHLQQITPRRWRLTGSVVAAMAVFAAAAATLAQNEAHRNIDPPPVQGRLYPPALRLAAPQSDDQFFDDVARLRDKLEANRKDDAR